MRRTLENMLILFNILGFDFTRISREHNNGNHFCRGLSLNGFWLLWLWKGHIQRTPTKDTTSKASNQGHKKHQLITIQGQKEDHHIWLKKAQNRGTTQSHKIRPQKHHLIKEQFKDKHKKDHHTRPQKKATKKAIEKGHKAPK